MKEYNIKSIRQEFRAKGVFYTQKELALYLRGFLPDDVSEVYDPTCGNGGLLSVFGDDVQKYGQDINASQVEEAAQCLSNFHGAAGDTLKAPAFADERFKYIIANPPFSIRWEREWSAIFYGWPCLPPKSKADFAFIAHVLHCLADDGVAVVLGFPGILYRGNSEGVIRRWLVEQNYVDTVVAVDGGQFVDTKIATVVLVLKKLREITDIRFIHKERERLVPQAEIADNEFNLSVSSYIIEEVKREKVDPLALETEARKSFLLRLKNELDFERAVCKLEGWEIEPFITAIEDVLKQYKTPRPA